ncbi:MAG: response regulator [Desulfobacterales bacterium]|nr:response regulator [Desulfobacterales bacterium]
MNLNEKPHILIVDDIRANVLILENLLSEDCNVSGAYSGAAALDIASGKEIPDLILLDIMMPEMDGYEVCRRLKKDIATRDIPVIFVTALTEVDDEAKGLSLGAADYITKPLSPHLVRARVKNQLELKRHRDHLEELVRERTEELEITQEVTIECMASLAECRDPETGGHIKRTQNYLQALAAGLSDHPKYGAYLDDKTVKLLYKSAPLHDIGKVAIRDSIFLKPGKLTVTEFNTMKKHTIYGRDTIQTAATKLGRDSFLRYAEEIAYTHQEKWDGSGYPQGLQGMDIPISGRLMAIADVYDALISNRVYKKPFTHTRAVKIILDGKGSHFDPDMVDAFMTIQEDFRQIAMQFADFEEEKEALAEPYHT